MKVGYITKSNKKGQIVIPKEVRNALGIIGDVSLNMVLRDRGVYLYPIEEVTTAAEQEDSYLRLLEQTKGKWGNDLPNIAKKKRDIELAASKKRKVW